MRRGCDIGLSNLAGVIFGAGQWTTCHLHLEPKLAADDRRAKLGGTHEFHRQRRQKKAVSCFGLPSIRSAGYSPRAKRLFDYVDLIVFNWSRASSSKFVAQLPACRHHPPTTNAAAAAAAAAAKIARIMIHDYHQNSSRWQRTQIAAAQPGLCAHSATGKSPQSRSKFLFVL